eukprot:scaffold62364_cov54-Phaeocystis_antarctica.AAC.7
MLRRACMVKRRWNGRWNGRLWRRLAREPEAVAGHAVGRPLPGRAEPPRAVRRARKRHRSRAGALPRGHCPGGTLAMLQRRLEV